MSNDFVARAVERELKRKDERIAKLEEDNATLSKRLKDETDTLVTFRVENAELLDIQKGLEDRNEAMCATLNETQPLLLKMQEQISNLEKEKWALSNIIKTRDAQIEVSSAEKREIAWFHSQRLAAIREQLTKEYNEVYMKLTAMLEREKATPEMIETLDSLRLLPWKYVI